MRLGCDQDDEYTNSSRDHPLQNNWLEFAKIDTEIKIKESISSVKAKRVFLSRQFIKKRNVIHSKVFTRS